MHYYPWQLKQPLDAVIFDCDGTLSQIEGINHLAEANQKGAEVSAITEAAMSNIGLNAKLFAQRLDLVKPTTKQIAALGEAYWATVTPGVVDIITVLQRLGKAIYILSAGIYASVAYFGQRLHVPKSHIYAVEVYFNAAGQYTHFDTQSPLINNNGKRVIIAQLKQQHPQALLIGDGLNDYSAHDEVTRFVGFGGVFYRQNIADVCQFYITTLSMLPLLPLSLTAQEVSCLWLEERELYEEGLVMLQHNKLFTNT